jgi:hypothetical protein
MRFLNFLILILFVTPLAGFAQSETRQTEIYTDSTTNFVEVAGYGSSNGHTPFWLQANQFGQFPCWDPWEAPALALNITGHCQPIAREMYGAWV